MVIEMNRLNTDKTKYKNKVLTSDDVQIRFCAKCGKLTIQEIIFGLRIDDDNYRNPIKGKCLRGGCSC